jgi:hypothetical protein
MNYSKHITKCNEIIADSIYFGNFSADGEGCEYELSMEWLVLCDDRPPSPRLGIFNDAFKAIDEHVELFKELSLNHNNNFTPDEFSEMLLRLGYKDFSDKKLE